MTLGGIVSIARASLGKLYRTAVGGPVARAESSRPSATRATTDAGTVERIRRQQSLTAALRLTEAAGEMANAILRSK